MRTYPGIPRSPATTTRYVFFIIAASRRSRCRCIHSGWPIDGLDASDLDVQRSKALTLGKSHVETVSAFVTYTDRFFGGRTNALSIHLYAAPMNAATRARLLANSRDDLGVPVVSVRLIDPVRRQAESSYASESAIYRARHHDGGDGRVSAGRPRERVFGISLCQRTPRLKSKGRYVPDSVSPDDEYTLSWDVNLDVAVVDRISAK